MLPAEFADVIPTIEITDVIPCVEISVKIPAAVDIPAVDTAETQMLFTVAYPGAQMQSSMLMEPENWVVECWGQPALTVT